MVSYEFCSISGRNQDQDGSHDDYKTVITPSSGVVVLQMEPDSEFIEG